MNPGNKSDFLMLASVSSTVGETVTCRIDTLGYDFLTITYNATSTAASSNSPSALKISHGATTTAASATDITALVGGGTGGFTIPAAPTNSTLAGAPIMFNIDLRGKARYLFLTTNVRTTQTLTVWGSLARGEQVGTAAMQGLSGLFMG